MLKRYSVAIALVVFALAGGLLFLAPQTDAQLQKGTEVTSPEVEHGGGTVFVTDSSELGSLAGALRCHINCIEEPDITVEGEITVEDCISICESYCGGPCSAQ